MRSLCAGLVLLFASAGLAQQSIAMPQVDVTATRIRHVPPLALTLKTETFGCDAAIQPGVADASDALTFASGPFADFADAPSLPQLAPLLSVSWSGGFHFDVIGAPVRAWPHLQLERSGWHSRAC